MNCKNEKKPNFIFGANYVPSYAVNCIEMWHKDTFDEKVIRGELEIASGWGYNCVRLFLSYVVWKQEGELFIKKVEKFLDIANSCGICVMPVIFDDCRVLNKKFDYSLQNLPIEYTHNSLWCSNPGVEYEEQYQLLKEYVLEICTHFKNDSRIFAWDLFNEPGNGERNIKSKELLLSVFEWVKDCGVSQAVTVGIWGYKLSPDNAELRELEKLSLEQSDVISFHNYDDADNLKDIIADLKKLNKPILCTEWLARDLGSKFETHLKIFIDNGVGCIQWGFFNGKTQTHYPWGWCEKKEPTIWFHDVFKKDGQPYDAEEMEFAKQVISEINSKWE